MAGKRDKTTSVVRGVLAPLVGMAAFWPLFQYGSFCKVLFPPGLMAALPFGSVSAHLVFLGALGALAIVAGVLWWRAGEALRRYRGVAVATMLFASLAAVIEALVVEGVLGGGWVWVAAPAAALGFLALYLAWATYFAARFGARELALLSLSLLVSLLFSAAGLLGKVATAVAMPAVGAICWFVAYGPDGGDERPAPSLRVLSGSPIPVVMAFLLVGAAVRGIVDATYDEQTLIRFGLSIVLCVPLAVGCCFYARRVRYGVAARVSCDFVALVAWLALAVLFVVGLFLFLIVNNQALGGGIVVVSRSLMGFVLWVLMCNLANTRHVAAIPLFVGCGLTTEVLSWILSYALMPVVCGTDGGRGLSPNSAVLAVILGIALVVLIVFGCMFIACIAQSPAGASSSQGEEGRSDEVPPEDLLVERAGLTAREAHVAVLYASGYSLAKVAEELGITRSTAQSHIKAAYRKLAVHSRDELIDWLKRSAGRG